MTDLSRTSAIKLGLAIAWPAFWTGVPFKVVLVLLFLAAGHHPWEMPALVFLLLLSIPIDIWALNLTSRTVFLERLHRDPPEGLGMTLWGQIAPLTAVYVWIASKVEGATIELAKAMVARLLDLVFKNLGVAERISIELVLWAAPATIMFLILFVGWLFGVGWIVRRQAAVARPSDAPYPVLVRRWDLLRVPRDQPLALTVFVLSGIVLVLLFWGLMPVKTPHPHEMYRPAPAKVVKPVMPTEVIEKTETIIAQAEASVKALEDKSKKGPGRKRGSDEKDKGKPLSKKADTKPEAASGKTDAHGSTGSPPRGDSKGESTPHSH
jgi:hypothetical protein